MDKPPRQLVALNALAVALSAQTQCLEAVDVHGLQVRAEELLSRDDALFRAICAFTSRFDLHRHSPDEWPELGRALHHAVDVAITPTPPDHVRSDIHG